MSELEKLRKVVAERTKGPWSEDGVYDVLKFHSRNAYDDSPWDYDRHKDSPFIATMGTHAEKIMAVIDAADRFANPFKNDLEPYDDVHRFNQMKEALTALKQALGEK